MLGLFIWLVSCGFSDNSISIIVELENGLIKEVQEGNLKKYLGIAYAEPPVGNLRWAPTKPVQNWKGIKSAESNSKIFFNENK